MDTPGSLLRSEREKQKKSLEDIEATLKISIKYLRAIEEDKYELLPADVFTKSYLRSYSGILGLENDPIIDLYDKQFKAPAANEPEPPKKALWKKIPRFKFKYIYLLAVCIGLITISINLYKKQGIEKPADAIPEVKTDIVETMNIKPPEPSGKALPAKDLSLEISASELTWVSIKIDSTDPEELLLRAGESTTVKADEKFVLKIGNAGGTSLMFNGTDLGNLGPHGQLIDITLP